jgi:hypothetical protein
VGRGRRERHSTSRAAIDRTGTTAHSIAVEDSIYWIVIYLDVQLWSTKPSQYSKIACQRTYGGVCSGNTPGGGRHVIREI